ncbi:acyl-CoA dehydrogenase family protein [Streptomyces sp. NPDC058280]|uniref:acyl-CoA dehydrogenase family protein n=1 Tax=Streptomyces sp. NPDC058280 TaxID=3346419 RepID=UPI0036E287EA
MPRSCFTTESHGRLRAQVREFAEAEVAPRVAHMEATRGVERDLVRAIARRGWIAVTVGPEYGGMRRGQRGGHLAKTIIVEELSRVSGAIGAAVQASQLGVAKIVHFGSAEQRMRWLPPIAAGDVLPTIAVTEKESGSHVLGMTGTAARDGDEYVLTGTKVFVGNSHIGDLHGVVARTGPGEQDLSAFLVEGDRPGVTLGPHTEAIGLRGFSFGEVRLEECRVPAANLLGRKGDGLAVAYSSSTLYGRPNLTAVALGIHQAVVEQTAVYAKETTRYGESLSRLPTIRQALGRMQSRLMTARLAAYHAVHLLDTGARCDYELMNAKLINTEMLLDSARDGMEVHAACGLFADRPIERYLRDAYHLYAPAGTSDVQRLRLSELALGQPKGREWSEQLADRIGGSGTR